MTEHADVPSVPNLKRQKVGGENIIQQHQIYAIPIRAPTINSSKEQNNPSIVAKTLDVNVAKTKVDTNKSRSQVLRIIDQVVNSYNSVNFESLLQNISTSSIQDVLLKVRLTPGSIDPSPNLQPNVSTTSEYVTMGVPSIFLLWMLFHETHPDGVMHVVDKRICYRQILNKIPASQVYPSIADQGNVSNRANSIPPHTVGASAPVSIVEAVLRFSGSCITSQPLQDLYCALAVGEWTRLVSSDNKSNSSNASNTKSAIPADTSGPPQQKKLPPPSGARRTSPVLCSEYISSFLTRKQLLSTSLSSTAARSTSNNSSSSGGSSGAEASAPFKCSATQCVHERGRRYLLEVRLVLDERDLVTEWAVSVLASESS